MISHFGHPKGPPWPWHQRITSALPQSSTTTTAAFNFVFNYYSNCHCECHHEYSNYGCYRNSYCHNCVNWWLGQVTEQVHSQEDDNKLTLAVAPAEQNLPSWGWGGAVRTLTMVFSELFLLHIPETPDVFLCKTCQKGVWDK